MFNSVTHRGESKEGGKVRLDLPGVLRSLDGYLFLEAFVNGDLVWVIRRFLQCALLGWLCWAPGVVALQGPFSWL